MRLARDVDAATVRQHDIDKNKVDGPPVADQGYRIGDAIDRGDDLIAFLGQQMFGVERDQRLVLDDEEPRNTPLLLPEHHVVSAPRAPAHRYVAVLNAFARLRSQIFLREKRNGCISRAMPTPPSDESPDERPEERQRIAKLLARAGVASRREVERMIADGRVARNGVAIDTPATLLASLDGVTVDGNPVEAAETTRLFLFHKPSGVLTAERDFSGRPTIYDKLPKDLPRLVPVGRLDLNTEGLLLMTTDGGFKRQLELPSTGVERAYRARAYGQVSQAQLEDLMHGTEIDGVRYGSINANLERRTGANIWIEMILTEGKNREVRRVLEHLGLRVSRLIRTRYGPFVLGDLPVGGIGEIRQADLAAFRQTLRERRPSDLNKAPVSVGALSISKKASPSSRAPAKAGALDHKSFARNTALLPPQEHTPLAKRGPIGDSRAPRRPTGQAGRSEQASTISGRKRSAQPTLSTQAAQTKRVDQGSSPNTHKPEPTHGREERDELETRAPRRDRPDAASNPRPPKPVRKAGWAKAKPKPRPHSKPRDPRK